MKKLLILMAITVAIQVTAQTTTESGDSLHISLDSVVVNGHRIYSPLSRTADGTSSWSMKMMHELPKILGNSDPMHYTQLLPSVQTNNEYDGGMHVQGCDNSHNYLSIDGVPLYNVSHLMGFFSIFNASHFSSLQHQTSAKGASYPNRLGGFLTMNLSSEIQDKMSGEFSVGMISSQGTIRFPFDPKQQLSISLRASYLNLLYSQWLKMEGNNMMYFFYDSNITYLYKPNQHNNIIIDGYLGNDEGAIGMNDYGADINAKWGNHSIAAHWLYQSPRVNMRNTLYNTRYHNRYVMNMNSLQISIPSDISDYGFKNDVTLGNSHLGIDVALHVINPQKPVVEGSFFDTSINASASTTRTIEASLFYDLKIPLSATIYSIPGLRATAYKIDGNTSYVIDPSISFTWQPIPQLCNRIGFACRHQHILQTGIESMGLPTTFWTSTGTDGIPVQNQQSIHINSEMKVMRGWYSVGIEMYYKWLQHQQEYFGTIYDFITAEYDIKDMLHQGRGRNYGINIIINKLKGSLKGWVSYSYGRALRQFTDIGNNKWYPSNHERIHELNAVMTQELGKRWNVGLTGVLANGTPFTAPRNYQIINGNLIACYGEHNANRLPPYFRIDISANYRLKSKENIESGLNLSLYNLTFSSNHIFYYMKVYNDQYYYHGMSFLTRILPSVSYYIKF